MSAKRRRLRAVIGFLAGLLLLLLRGREIRQRRSSNNPPYSGARWQHDQEVRVQEAVFRYQIAENRHHDEICFLSVREASPAPALMQHFAGLPYVLPVSQQLPTDRSHTRQGTTDRSALKFWVDRLNWDSDTELHVEGGGGALSVPDGNLPVRGGDAGKFTVAWKQGEWKVEKYEPEVIF